MTSMGNAYALTTKAKTIMLVDNDKDVLDAIGRGLKTLGFHVHSFRDALKALHHVEDGCQRCGILVSDIRMSELTGFQLARRLKEMRPDMKIVLMSAFEINKSEAKILLPSTPIEEVIRKPFPLPQLAELLTQTYNASNQKLA